MSARTCGLRDTLCLTVDWWTKRKRRIQFKLSKVCMNTIDSRLDPVKVFEDLHAIDLSMSHIYHSYLFGHSFSMHLPSQVG